MHGSFKGTIALICAVFMVFSLFILPVGADTEDCSLTLDYKSEESGAISGCDFGLYLVAEGGLHRYKLALAFTGVEADFEQVDWSSAENVDALTETLTAYIAENSVSAYKTGTTDEDGKLSFDGLPQGLYLALGATLTNGGLVYTPQPVLIWLPCANPEGGLDYNPVCTLKYDKHPVPPESSEEPPSEEPSQPETSEPSEEPSSEEPSDVPPGETINISVKKLWSGSGSHPSSVTVRLLCDGKKYEDVTLSAANGWAYLWKDLSADHEWSVEEINIPAGYTAHITVEGTAFTVTNIKKLPQTGQLWWPIPYLLGGGLIILTLGVALHISGKKKKG